MSSGHESLDTRCGGMIRRVHRGGFHDLFFSSTIRHIELSQCCLDLRGDKQSCWQPWPKRIMQLASYLAPKASKQLSFFVNFPSFSKVIPTSEIEGDLWAEYWAAGRPLLFGLWPSPKHKKCQVRAKVSDLNRLYWLHSAEQTKVQFMPAR